MSSPRDRHDDPDEGTGWQEPAHLSGDGQDDDPAGEPPNFADRRRVPREDPPADQWVPEGWDLPPAQRDAPGPAAGRADAGTDQGRDRDTDRDTDRGAEQRGSTGWWTRPPREEPPASSGGQLGGWPAPEHPQPDAGQQPPVQQPPAEQPRPGLFGRRAPRRPSELQQVFAYQGDLVGSQAWAVQNGWTVSDGTTPQDAVLHELVASAPVRATKDHRPAGVMRGRADALDLVAFDVVYASGRHVVPEYAITAAPLLTPVPYFRLSPARLWKHRTGGLVPIESGDAGFDSRWTLLAAEDGPGVRRLAADLTVRGLLLNTDDGDEFWSAAGHVAAVRPDGHRPQLIEHHARLLAALVRVVGGS